MFSTDNTSKAASHLIHLDGPSNRDCCKLDLLLRWLNTVFLFKNEKFTIQVHIFGQLFLVEKQKVSN